MTSGFVKRAVTNGYHDILTKFPNVATLACTTKVENKSSFSNFDEGVVDVLDASPDAGTAKGLELGLPTTREAVAR